MVVAFGMTLGLGAAGLDFSFRLPLPVTVQTPSNHQFFIFPGWVAAGRDFKLVAAPPEGPSRRAELNDFQ
jgi:hypothetical protein